MTNLEEENSNIKHQYFDYLSYDVYPGKNFIYIVTHYSNDQYMRKFWAFYDNSFLPLDDTSEMLRNLTDSLNERFENE